MIYINKNWVRELTEALPILQYIIQWSDGLDFEKTQKEEERPDKYLLGANPVPQEVMDRNRLNPERDWTDYWPVDEPQSSSVFETFSCTLFSLFNCLEAVAKKKYGEDWNKSERFNAGMVKLRPPGYTLTGAFDSVRKLHGAVKQETYPNVLENLAQWIANPPTDAVEEGKWWLENYTIYMVEVPATRAGILQGLEYSPVWCGGYAWYPKNGVYISFGNPNHAFPIKRYDGENAIVGDSYDPFEKKLASDYKIWWPKFLIVEKKTPPEYNQAEINKLLQRGLKYIMRPLANGEMYELTDKGLRYVDANEARDLGLRTLEERKDFVGISEELYEKLINNQRNF